MAHVWVNDLRELDAYGCYSLAKSAQLSAKDCVSLYEASSQMEAGSEKVELLKRGLAENSVTPGKVLLLLIKDSHPGIRLAVLTAMDARQGLPAKIFNKIFETLMRDSIRMIREEVALNECTPREVFFAMAEIEEEEEVRLSLVKNLSLPLELLQLMAEKDQYPAVRLEATAILRQSGRRLA